MINVRQTQMSHVLGGDSRSGTSDTGGIIWLITEQNSADNSNRFGRCLTPPILIGDISEGFLSNLRIL
jgi:hypothetical protein